MKRTILLSLTCSLLAINGAVGSEADTFTRRNEFLADSTEIINLKANQAISDSILNANANANNSGCIEKNLYKSMRLYFNNHMKGKLTIDIINNTEIPKRIISLHDSIYGNWTPANGFGLGLGMMKKAKSTLASVVILDKQLVGVDKFEHMFGQGFLYFTDNYLKNKGPITAAKKGAMREKLMLGGNILENGVFSYGDLAANFNGMRLWNHMLQLRDDVLGADHNIGPYIACENDKWVQVKEIDFRNYIDDSMDEAVNCSKFTTKATVKKFTKTINDLGFSCPVDQRRLDDLKVKYGPMAKYMINEQGTAVVKYFSEFSSKK
jgi:hypothetical protein